MMIVLGVTNKKHQYITGVFCYTHWGVGTGILGFDMKRIVFFDGDGTLWYPKSTKRTQKPHWIYHDPLTMNDHKSHLILTPYVVSTLRELKKREIIIVIISTHPHSAKDADVILNDKVRHFGLETLVDEVHAARNVPTGKGVVIARVLKRLKLPKSSALMVGDSYVWDYLAAKKVGVDGLLMDVIYLNKSAGQVKRKIKNLDEVLKYINKK